MTYTVIGFGSRGALYAGLFAKNGGAELTAVCETQPDRLEAAGRLYGLPKERLFASETEFAAAGRLGDLCVVATQDGQHKRHTLSALNAGYDVLLEKPIATDFADCRSIFETAEKLKRRVFVCHVLRYAPFFALIKNELDTGAYGGIATINLTENVAYWHFAHSFVRGNWSVVPPSAPMIVAKSCHDLDIISWLMDAECEAVSSVGGLSFFTRENAPPDSGERCLDCAVKGGCAYDAERFYLWEHFDKGLVSGWSIKSLCENPTREKVIGALKNGAYGRCVWKCGNNAADSQIVNMRFAGGAAAHLTTTAFSKDEYREIHVHCQKGEIFGNMRDNILTCNIFGKESKTINVKAVSGSGYGHGGGDAGLINDIAAVYNGQSGAGLTSLESSMQSHAMGFAAEESRLSGGKLVLIGKQKGRGKAK